MFSGSAVSKSACRPDKSFSEQLPSVPAPFPADVCHMIALLPLLPANLDEPCVNFVVLNAKDVPSLAIVGTALLIQGGSDWDQLQMWSCTSLSSAPQIFIMVLQKVEQ